MGQIGLFESSGDLKPLAYRSRPEQIEDYCGQKSGLARVSRLDFNHLPHIVFWGPPGCGKTTLAHILANKSSLELFSFNAVLGGVNDLRKIIANALELQKMGGKKSIIFIDEIHRFNKSQQDALLPHLEKGDFILFGATTEYPQTTLNPAILSRIQVIKLTTLSDDDLFEILQKAAINEDLIVPSNILKLISNYSRGDARVALNHLEVLVQNKEKVQDLSESEIKSELLNFQKAYDKNSNRHYDVISAFIKSIRGSDSNAALLWLAVMLEGGEDIEFIARRLIILASEDIGLADNSLLSMATSCHYAIKQIGMPEARIILSQTVCALAQAPKSNKAYLAINSALSYVENNPTVEVPTHLRNHHPDKQHYKYPHNYPNAKVDQKYSYVDEKFLDD